MLATASSSASLSVSTQSCKLSSAVLIRSPGRNEKYLGIVRQFTFDVSRARYIMSWFPKPMKKVVGPFLPWARRATQQVSVFLRPMIEDRQSKLKELGENWSDKPVGRSCPKHLLIHSPKEIE